jgi:hypothetical protein
MGAWRLAICGLTAALACDACAQLSFTEMANVGTAYSAVGVVALDVDRDGRPDPVVLSKYGYGLSTFFNDPGLVFQLETFFVESSASSVAAGPLDSGPGGAGGGDDLLIGRSAGAATILLNRNVPRGQARWQTPNSTSYSTNPNATRVAVQMFNGSTSTPTLLALSSSTKKSTSRTGDGSGGFPGTDTNTPMTEAPGQMAFGDFTGDGKTDMAVLFPESGTIAIYKFVRTLCCPNPNGNPNPEGVDWIELPSLSVGSPARAIAATDVNGDGKCDLIVGLDRIGFLHARVRVLLGNADGTFTAAASDIDITDGRGDVTALLPIRWDAGQPAETSPDTVVVVTSNENRVGLQAMGSLAAAAELASGTGVDISDDGNVIVGNTTGNVAWVWRSPGSYWTIPVPAGYVNVKVQCVSGQWQRRRRGMHGTRRDIHECSAGLPAAEPPCFRIKAVWAATSGLRESRLMVQFSP